jgi:hypothetical protein
LSACPVHPLQARITGPFMAYLIYTDRSNLLKSLKTGLIRVPWNLRAVQELSRIRKGEIIFFYDFENDRIYGPSTAAACDVIEEKNPRSGPFNGPGSVRSHYRYLKLPIESSSVYRKGVPASSLGIGPDEVRFHLEDAEEQSLLSMLARLNVPPVPAVIHISASGRDVKASIVEIEKGSSIFRFSFRIGESVPAILERKRRKTERALLEQNGDRFNDCLKETGSLVYESFFARMNCRRFFTGGGYRIDFACDGSVAAVPFEASYDGCFLFEKNIISFRSDETRPPGAARFRRALVFAEPGSGSAGYREGMFLFHLFAGMGVEVDLCARALAKDRLAEMFPEYDVVHFIGKSAQVGRSTAWDIGGSPFCARDLCSRGPAQSGLSSTGPPFLVFSHSCGCSPGFGLQFLRAGVANVVMPRWKIPFGSLTPFLFPFYSQLLKGEEIGFSFKNALDHCYANRRIVPLAFVLLGESRLVYER